MDLYLTQSQLQQMITHVDDALPNEACGFLAGLSGRVLQVYPVTNVEKSAVRFRMDAAEQIRSITKIEQAGWNILGIFHSHPCGPQIPSEIDRGQADAYPQTVCVILSRIGPGLWHPRGFQMNNQQWVEVTLQSEGLNDQP